MAFSTYAPKLFNYYGPQLNSLYTHDCSFRRNFDNSAFPAATFNFGPATECFPHTDFANLPHGWCAITALGNYDHTMGGHLVLWDSHLVIEFPPGSSILIPSGILRHSNTSIPPHSERYSFTQYAAGGLFRWIDHGMQTQSAYNASVHKKKSKTIPVHVEAQKARMAMLLFSTVDELVGSPR